MCELDRSKRIQELGQKNAELQGLLLNQQRERNSMGASKEKTRSAISVNISVIRQKLRKLKSRIEFLESLEPIDSKPSSGSSRPG